MNVQRPRRVRHSYTQHLNGPPDSVFPLLCPVREADWIPHWDPSLVLSESGVAEPDCMFVTRDGDADAVWIVSDHRPRDHRLTMYKVTPMSTVARIDIALRPDGEARTRAEISYEFTALSPSGADALQGLTEEWYHDFMRRWETGLNHFLETGRRIEAWTAAKR